MKFPTTIAYNKTDMKVGCVLLQAALGAKLPTETISRYFDGHRWELDPSKCKLFTLYNQEEFDRVIKLTNI